MTIVNTITKKKIKILITIFSIITSFFLFEYPLHSQKLYTLKECLDIVLIQNFDLVFYDYQKQYDSVLKKNAFGYYFPTVNTQSSYSRTILNTTNHLIELNNLSFGITANLLLYDGGRRKTNYRNTDNILKLTELQKQYLTEQLKLQVYSQFINIIRLKEIVKTRIEDIKVSQNQLDNINARYETGVVPIEIVLSQEVELGNKEIALLQQEIDYNIAKQNLLITMGINSFDNVDFVDDNIPKEISNDAILNFKNKIGDVNSAINSAFKNRIDYFSLQTCKEISKNNIDVSKAGYYPTLNANFNYGYSGWNKFDNDNFSGSILLNLNIPIFNNFASDLVVQQSELSFQKDNTNILKLEQSIRAEVQTAYFNLESSEKAIQISKKALLAAKQNFEAVAEKFNIGSASITDYITANSQYITAQINIITSTFTYLSTQKNLLFIIGQY